MTVGAAIKPTTSPVRSTTPVKASVRPCIPATGMAAQILMVGDTRITGKRMVC